MSVKKEDTGIEKYKKRIAEALRNSKFRSKSALAKHLGKRPNTVTEAFKRPPRRETLEEIAQALGVDYAWLETGIKKHAPLPDAGAGDITSAQREVLAVCIGFSAYFQDVQKAVLAHPDIAPAVASALRKMRESVESFEQKFQIVS